MLWKKNKPDPAASASPKIGRTGEAVSGEINEETIRRASTDLREKETIREEKKVKEKAPRRRKEKRVRGVLAEETGDIYRTRGRIDMPMLVIILMLICFGSVMVFSASYAYSLDQYGDSFYFVKRQLAFSFGGIALMFGISFFDYKLLTRKILGVNAVLIYFAVALVMLLLVLVLGVAEGEAVRWLDFKLFTVQPSEVMKLGMVLMLAWYYSVTESKVRCNKFFKSSAFGTFIPLIIVAIVCALIMAEKHLSGTIIMFAIGMVVVFAAGGRWYYFLAIFAGAAAAVYVLIGKIDYLSKRVDIFLNPENYSAQSEVWQTLQGKYAVGSGGIFGVGLGNSRQKHLFVSQPHNDFIFAIVCEELGMIGALCVIALFIAFLVRGIIIAKRAPDTFSKLVVIGITSKVVIQAFLNIAVVTNLIPNTGISLPFFSYGGTALLMLFLEMGILLSISRYSCMDNL